MDTKTKVHDLIREMTDEIYDFIKKQENTYKDSWVPAVDIKKKLEINFVCVPKDNKQYGEKGWLFAIIARILEDENRVEYKKVNKKAFYKTK